MACGAGALPRSQFEDEVRSQLQEISHNVLKLQETMSVAVALLQKFEDLRPLHQEQVAETAARLIQNPELTVVPLIEESTEDHRCLTQLPLPDALIPECMVKEEIEDETEEESSTETAVVTPQVSFSTAVPHHTDISLQIMNCEAVAKPQEPTITVALGNSLVSTLKQKIRAKMSTDQLAGNKVTTNQRPETQEEDPEPRVRTRQRTREAAGKKIMVVRHCCRCKGSRIRVVGTSPSHCRRCLRQEADVEISEKHSCPLCKVVFPSKSALKDHVDQHPKLRGRVKRLAAKQQQKKVKGKAKKQPHKNFKCKWCKDSFVNLRSLTLHTVIHTNPAFAEHDKQRTLLKMWHEVRSVPEGVRCDMCSGTFPSTLQLRMHNQLHHKNATV